MKGTKFITYYDKIAGLISVPYTFEEGPIECHDPEKSYVEFLEELLKDAKIVIMDISDSKPFKFKNKL